MKTVIIRAPLLSISGYGVHSRQIFRWLLDQPVKTIVQIVPWGNTSWMINPDMEGGLAGEIMQRSQSPETTPNPDISIQVQLPNEWDPNLAKINIGVSAWVETDRCNPEWIAAANKMTEIVVPSEFTKQVILNTGSVTVPIHVIPEAFIEQVSKETLPEVSLELDTSFNFLLVGQITGNNPETDRKNTMYALKWLCETFKDDPQVGVIIKTNSARSTSIDRMHTRKMLVQAISQIRTGEYPKIHFLHGELSSDEMASLYRHPTVKAFVALTRGEGWGLPILEAAASGLPVIATNWSGHLDFLNHGRFIPVSYALTTIPDSKVDNKIFVPGAKWANPDENDAKEKLHKFRKKPDIPMQWANELKKKLLVSFSQSAISNVYTEKLGHLMTC
jgi:glycosyltransferase involved in cell wall biosynthesis